MVGASSENLAFLPGTSAAALIFTVERSSAPSSGSVTEPVNVPVTSTVLRSLRLRTDSVRISLGSVRAGRAGVCAPQAARTSDAVAMNATKMSAKRRVTNSPQ
jgi:hypothetical protein